MPPSKTGWSSLNVIFPPVMQLVLDDPKKRPFWRLLFEFMSSSWKAESRISAKSIAEQLGISHERVKSIIHEDVDMRKLCMKWVPKCLNTDQTHQRCQSSEQLLEFFWRDPNDFLS
jgi:hypothetical protein